MFDNKEKNCIQKFFQRNSDIFLGCIALNISIITIVISITLPILAYYLIDLVNDIDKLISEVNYDYLIASGYFHKISNIIDMILNICFNYVTINYSNYSNSMNFTNYNKITL